MWAGRTLVRHVEEGAERADVIALTADHSVRANSNHAGIVYSNALNEGLPSFIDLRAAWRAILVQKNLSFMAERSVALSLTNEPNSVVFVSVHMPYIGYTDKGRRDNAVLVLEGAVQLSTQFRIDVVIGGDWNTAVSTIDCPDGISLAPVEGKDGSPIDGVFTTDYNCVVGGQYFGFAEEFGPDFADVDALYSGSGAHMPIHYTCRISY
jgi:hypothetical protein